MAARWTVLTLLASVGRVEASLAGPYVRLLIGEVGFKGGVALSDVQVGVCLLLALLRGMLLLT